MESKGGPCYLLAGFAGAMLAVVSIAFASSPIAKDVFEGLRASATLVVGAIGVWVAFQGLQTWKRQLYGGARFDAARKLQESAVRLRREIAAFRYPVQTYVAKPDETEEQARRRTAIGRFNRVSRRLTQCEVAAIPLQVLLGHGVVDAVDGLRRIIVELRIELDYQFDDEAKLLSPEDLHHMRAILFETPSNQSKAFTEQINLAFRTVDELTAPLIRDRMQ